MDNKKIANHFNLLGKLMELHEDNPFKIRTYTNAYHNLRRLDVSLKEMDEQSLLSMHGIGKALASKIIELVESGEMKALNNMLDKTPPGVIDILKLKGLGAKKVRSLWRELEISNLGELEYACMENRLLGLKGFGQKTQISILEQIAFLKKSEGQALLHTALELSTFVLTLLKEKFPDERFQETAKLRRRLEVIDKMVFVGTVDEARIGEYLSKNEAFSKDEKILSFEGIEIVYFEASEENFESILFESTGPESFLNNSWKIGASSEMEIFKEAGLLFIPPECRDVFDASGHNRNNPESLISKEIVKGVIHAHTRWSDGAANIQEMVDACIKEGYKYLLLTDHSRSAFYANGLNEARVYDQWAEIDSINEMNPGFRVFKGIESDILNNGELDYPDDLLDHFEVIISSVHSNLKMDEEKANSRLLKAIEHPATRILGHMTGRLLLSRPGYPVDHKLIIDACAANKVAIEINSNPHRLDIDWRWLPYAVEKGVEIALSPDAHNLKGILDMQYGIVMARKGWVPQNLCLNAKSTKEFEQWIGSK